MAEIVGVVASAVTLFSLCMQGFDFIDTVKQYEYDVHKLTIKLTIEKCRLYAWGENMGLTVSPGDSTQTLLEGCKFAETIKDTLRLILQILDSSQRTREKYGCQKVLEPLPLASSLEFKRASAVLELSASFRSDKAAGKQDFLGSKYVEKTWWAIRDKAKFEKLIVDAKDLIDGLQEITKDVISRSKQDRFVSEHMTRSNDIRSLQNIAAVCRESYPSISDAASCRAARLSLYVTDHEGVKEWAHSIENALDDVVNTTTMEDIESMTVTELKHKLRSALHYSSVPKEQSLAETQEYGRMLQKLQNEAFDKDLYEEVDAISQWFDVVSMEEQMFTLCVLAQMLNKRQRKFASTIFQAAEDSVPPAKASNDDLLRQFRQVVHKEQRKLEIVNVEEN